MFYEGHDIYSRAFSVKPTGIIKIARFVKQDGLGGVTLTTAATDTPVGICMEEFSHTGNGFPNFWPNRQGVRVRMIGSGLVEAEGVIAYGDPIAIGTDGKAKKATGTEKVVGEAFTPTTAAGEYVLVFLKIV